MRPDTQAGWKMMRGKPQANMLALDHPQQVEAPWIDWTVQSFAANSADGWPYLRYHNTVTGEEYWEMGLGPGVPSTAPQGAGFSTVDEEGFDASTGLPSLHGGNVPNKHLQQSAAAQVRANELQARLQQPVRGRSPVARMMMRAQGQRVAPRSAGLSRMGQ